MGGYDIFYSDMINERWTDPVNIGYPINTTGDNLFYFPIDNEKLAYFATIEKDGTGFSDIFLIEILEKPAVDQETGEVLFEKDFSLLLIDQETSDTLVIYFNSADQRFHLNQPASKFKIIINK
jgi:hypothetical protein